MGHWLSLHISLYCCQGSIMCGGWGASVLLSSRVSLEFWGTARGGVKLCSGQTVSREILNYEECRQTSCLVFWERRNDLESKISDTFNQSQLYVAVTINWNWRVCSWTDSGKRQSLAWSGDNNVESAVSAAPTMNILLCVMRVKFPHVGVVEQFSIREDDVVVAKLYK